MTKSNPKVDPYFSEGCGRCPQGGTPHCKVHNWTEELQQLRSVLLDSDLEEELKWGVPCYTFQKKNVVVLSALKESCTLGFFKGALLRDTHNILEKPGENTQAARQICFTSLSQILDKETILKDYIKEAIEVEKAGLKVEFKKPDKFDFPDELLDKFEEDPAYKKAFHALTPGRQRGYLLHFSQPKQSSTKLSRIEKCREKIFLGKGFNDR